MADKKISPLVWLLGAIGVGTIIYSVATPTTALGANQQVPGGAVLNTQWGQWTNNTGAPVWVNATGMIVNGAGTLMGNIADIINAVNSGGSGSGTNSGGTTVLLGTKNRARIGEGLPGRHYNPQPGGLM